MGSNFLFSNFCSTSCSLTQMHKKNPKKILMTVYTRINWKWYFASQTHSGLLKVLIWQMHQAYIVIYKASCFFKTGLHFCPVFVLPSSKIGRSRVFEWHYIINNNGMHLLILTLPLILSMYFFKKYICTKLLKNAFSWHVFFNLI